MISKTSPSAPKVGWRSAAALVVANIIGVGIFTTAGFQAESLGHPGWIMVLWCVGGVLAFCGALCYAELGAAIPRQGAEYAYLTETLGPAFGFMSAFVSLVAGFSAPIASAAKGFSAYLSHFIPALGNVGGGDATFSAANLVAVALCWTIILVQLLRSGAWIRLNDAVTLIKIGGILAIIIAAFAAGRGAIGNLFVVSPAYASMTLSQVLTALGTSMIFVMFCYSGWNAAAYIAEEIDQPQRNLPRALLMGTALVIALYLLLNMVYLYGADVTTLAGKAEVGLVAARNLWGPAGVSAITIVILISIVASISAMTIAGPRVYFALGRDCPWLRFLARVQHGSGTPVGALLLQGLLTTTIIFSGRLDEIMQYAGFTLSLFASLAVACVIILRIRRPDLPRPFRIPLYPLPPLLFLGVMLWTMFWSFQGKPAESIMGLMTVLIGGMIYWFSLRHSRR